MVKESKKVTNNLGYCGEVNAQLLDKKGNVCGSKTFHNGGRWPLYLYFCKAVAGGVDEQLRPKYIQLCSAGDKGDTKPVINNSNPLKYGSDSDVVKSKLSNSIITNKVMLSTYTSDEESETAVTIKFLIPVVDINLSSPINLLLLESVSGLSDVSNASAYAFVEDEEDSTKLGSLIDAEAIEGHQNEYNLSITWTLKFKNILG